MKIKPEHLAHIRTEMLKSGATHTLKAYLDAGLTEKRWRWDWCYRTPGLSKWICDNIYPYANDEHLDTALKCITKGV